MGYKLPTLKYIKKNKKVDDPSVIKDAVCYVYGVTEAQILAPIESEAQAAYSYLLFKNTPLSNSDIANIFGYMPPRMKKIIFNFYKTVTHQCADFSEDSYGKIEDCRQYCTIHRSRKDMNPIHRGNKRQVVESYGIDYLEFIRWDRKVQMAWLKERIPDFMKRKGKRYDDLLEPSSDIG